MAEPFNIKPGDTIDVTPVEVVGTPKIIQVRNFAFLQRKKKTREKRKTKAKKKERKI